MWPSERPGGWLLTLVLSGAHCGTTVSLCFLGFFSDRLWKSLQPGPKEHYGLHDQTHLREKKKLSFSFCVLAKLLTSSEFQFPYPETKNRPRKHCCKFSRIYSKSMWRSTGVEQSSTNDLSCLVNCMVSMSEYIITFEERNRRHNSK